MVEDPVCGIQINEAEAAGKVGYWGRAYYFCSVFCMAAFVEDAEKYMAGEEKPLQHNHPRREVTGPKVGQRA
jgi:YHS domain-containing protein